jgi:uncharacterized protein
MPSTMKEFVKYLIETIAKNPEDVVVEEKQLDETYIREEITVHPDDMGLVIGRNGRTIQSVRELAKAKAIKQGVKVDVELLEPDREKEEAVEAPTEETSEEQSVLDEVEAEVEAMVSELEDTSEEVEEVGETPEE